MGISEKQIKLVESILYQGNEENLVEVDNYIQALVEFRKQLTEKEVVVE